MNPAASRLVKPARPELPAGDLERKIMAIWQKVVGAEKTGVTDNFFDLGGNSLKTIRVTIN